MLVGIEKDKVEGRVERAINEQIANGKVRIKVTNCLRTDLSNTVQKVYSSECHHVL